MSSLTNIQTSVVRVPATTLVPDKIAALAAAAAALASEQATAADRVQTGLDRTATGQDAGATAADRVQTGLDRTATGQDAGATAADRVQTGLDRTATGQDATATAADRVQTGLDRTAVAEDREAVETARDVVADLKADTETFRNDAEQFRNQAGESAGQASEAAGDATTAANAAAADRVQTGLDRTAVANDKSAVASDKATVATDKNAAAVSAGAAAAAAASITSSLLNQNRGVYTAAALPTTLPNSGDWARISTGGTIYGHTFVSGDLAVYSGTPSTYHRIAAGTVDELRLLAGDRRAESRAYIRVDSGVSFNASNSRGYVALTNCDFATSVLTMGATAENIGSITGVRVLSVISSSSLGTSAGRFSLYRDVNDLCVILFNAAGDGWRKLTNASYFTANNTGLHDLFVTWARAAAPLVYGNGVVLAMSETTGGVSVPVWTDPLTSGHWVVGGAGSEVWRGAVVAPRLLNRVLSAAEILEYTRCGRLPWMDELTTGAVTPLYTSNFATTDGWGGVNGGSTAVSGGRLQVTSVVGNLNSGTTKNVTNAGGILIMPAGRYRLSITAKLLSGTAGNWTIGHGTFTAGMEVLSGTNSLAITGSDQTFTFEFLWRSPGSFFLRADSARDSVMDIASVVLTSIGEVVKPRLQVGARIHPDGGFNRLPMVTCIAAHVVGTEMEPTLVVPIPAMSADALLHPNSEVLVPLGYCVIRVEIERTAGSSTGTITLRENSSGGTTVASGTLAANVALTVSSPYVAQGRTLHLANSSWASSTIRGMIHLARI